MKRFFLTLFIAICAAILFGYGGAKTKIFNSYLALIPWGLGALILGYFVKNKGAALLNGFIYGFLVSLVFLIANYTGIQVILKVIFPYFIIIALIGGVCGLVLEFIGSFLPLNIWKKKSNNQI